MASQLFRSTRMGLRYSFLLNGTALENDFYFQAEEYNGKRELAELAKFVEKHLVVEEPVKEEKDEL